MSQGVGMKSNNDQDLKTLARICKMYYVLNMKQTEIALIENMSKSTISRLLNQAKELGYIAVHLNFPQKSKMDLEMDLEARFNLNNVTLCESFPSNERLMFVDISRSIVDTLNHTLVPGSTLALSWGNTLNQVSENLTPMAIQDVEVVQLNGGITHISENRVSDDILLNFARNLSGSAKSLNVPSLLGEPFIASALKRDPRTHSLLEKARHANIALFAIGSVGLDSVLVEAGFFTAKSYQEDVVDKGYVGDVCSHYLLPDGRYVADDLYNRVVGITLDELKVIPTRMGVAVGVKKARAVLAALRAGLITDLYIDEQMAIEICALDAE